MDSVAFNNIYEDVEFIEDCPTNRNVNENVKKKCDKKNKLLKRVLLDGFVILVICVVILFGWNWLKPSKQCAKTETSLVKFSNSIASKIDPEMERKQKFVKEMMVDSWNAYVRYAWGHEALKPVSKSVYSHLFGNNSGLSIVASMSTLWTMDLKDEFEKAKLWIETKLDLKGLSSNVVVFEAITHYVGGLLSCYALTSESMFLNKSIEIGLMMKPAFNTKTGIPYEDITLNTSVPSDSQPYLSYLSGFQLDYNYLSQASNDLTFRDHISKILSRLKDIDKTKNLYARVLNSEGTWGTTDFDLFTESRELFISLVKSFIQSNLKNVQSIEMYKEALDAIDSIKMFEESPGGHYYTRSYYFSSNTYGQLMYYSGCYLGAKLSIGAKTMKQALDNSIGENLKSKELYRIYRHWQLAEKLTETCNVASMHTRTGLGPYSFIFNNTHEAAISGNGYYLSPELAESNFILWRLTHDPKYRDYAWEMVLALKRFCWIKNGGFAGINHVDVIPTPKDDFQRPHFLSATLKYLYLIFTDDDVLSLDQWVFNAQGHPLFICGKNSANPEVNCKF